MANTLGTMTLDKAFDKVAEDMRKSEQFGWMHGGSQDNAPEWAKCSKPADEEAKPTTEE